MELYFAPINLLSNYVYRHLVLECGADYVFSELILVRELDKAVRDDKLKLIDEDIPRTIFQIGVSTPKDVFEGVSFVKEYVSSPFEININMGCPQSTMQQTKICGGILFDVELVGVLSKALADACKYTTTIPSIKIRLGTDPKTILLDEYLTQARDNGVFKVYIHARTLRHSYHKESRYQFFSGLRNRYPDMNLVFNGDVDSPLAFEQIGGGKVLIARAALSNPLLFADIKNDVEYPSGPYAPEMKDPGLIRNASVTLSKRKISVIRRYIQLATKYDLRKTLYVNNMRWLTKGASCASQLNKLLNTTTSVYEVSSIFENWLED